MRFKNITKKDVIYCYDEHYNTISRFCPIRDRKNFPKFFRSKRDFFKYHADQIQKQIDQLRAELDFLVERSSLEE